MDGHVFSEVSLQDYKRPQLLDSQRFEMPRMRQLSGNQQVAHVMSLSTGTLAVR